MDTERLTKYAAEFADLLKSGEFNDHIADHRRRSEQAQELLQEGRIPSLTEEEVRELFLDSDSYGFWSDKDKHFQKQLAKYGLDTLRNQLAEVVRIGQGNVTPEDLATLWRGRGLGTLLSTELLCYRFPQRHYTYSRNVTLEALHALGQPIWFEMPHGQRNDHHVYVTLAPYMEQVRDALREAGVPDADYLVTDVFLWWVKNTLTPLPSIEDLVHVLGETERTKENMAVTVPFIDAVLHSFGIQVPDVTTFRPKKSAPDPNPQYLAYGTARILEPVELRDGKSTTSLNLMVQVSPGRHSSSGEIFWGYHLWGTKEWRDIVREVLESRGILREDGAMAIRVETGALGVPSEVFPGGAYLAAGKLVSPEQLHDYDNTEQLVQTIADDLAGWYSEWSERAEEVEAELRARVPIPRYWRIVPGEGGKYWDQFRDHSVIGVGWIPQMNLEETQFESKDQLKQALTELDDPPKSAANAANTLWPLYSEMQPGDLVCAYGGGKVLAWGEITGAYAFAHDDFPYTHRRDVVWKAHGPVSKDMLPPEVQGRLGLFNTVTQLTAEQFEQIQRALPEVRNVWIFQGRPDMYDMDGMLAHSVVDDWRMARYHKRSAIGDRVLFWKAGNEAGIYGVGTIISKPYHRADQDDMAVDVSIGGRLATPILAETIEKHPVLSQMLIMRQRQGVDFPVTPEEWQALEPMLGEIIIPRLDILPLLQSRLRAQGFRFTDWQVACFYTALQTKGFVLLSGISGTGKTKLAQLFADMLPQPRVTVRSSEEVITVTVKPYMLKYNRVIIPRQSLHLFSPPPPGETRDVTIIFPGGEQQCALTHAKYERTEYVQIMFRGEAREWVRENLAEGDQLILEPALADTGDLTGFRLATGDDPDRAAAAGAELEPGSNHLFLPVRPDWRDSKSLLGYYNPLDNAYHWTEFLRFLVRARESHDAGDGLAWFVLLDEMNLAHVEYYFADLLSVMESGRDPETGLTREALRLDCPEDAEGELPPAQLHLPPNLYVIGTVNVDETTQAFSPKVLDRAFTIEFSEVSFEDYPPAFEGEAEDLSDGMRRGLLAQFTGDGAFARVDKGRIAQTAAAHPVYRTWLGTLNDGLRERGLHFGYRVFDEIHVFLSWAEESGVFEAQGGLEAAFDAAVLMKVLPKFNGSRAKLEGPLIHVLAWCLQLGRPDETRVIEALRADEASGSATLTNVSALSYGLSATARKALRMMRALQIDGFAAFGG